MVLSLLLAQVGSSSLPSELGWISSLTRLDLGDNAYAGTVRAKGKLEGGQ